MTNIETIDMANRSELAKILARQKWCEGCPLDLCGTKECADHIETWMGMECEENPPTDNKSQGDISPEVKADLKKITEGFDVVNKPAHYVKGGMECIDFIRAIVSDLTPYEAYCLGNVVKYLWRFKDKNGVIDLDKAVRYIEFLKEAQRNGEQ